MNLNQWYDARARSRVSFVERAGMEIAMNSSNPQSFNFRDTFNMSVPLSVMLGLLLVPSAAATGPTTYSEHVAPIFFEHCVACHRPGQIAPMSLLSYTEARPWAKSIARVVQAREMPPWSGESDHREWSNDISLNDEEIATLVRWVEQGAREGKKEDLPTVPTFPETWALGEPDYIITLDEIAIPAEGDDLFPKQWVELDLKEAQWVRAMEFLPGDRRAAHHVQTTYMQTTYNTPAMEDRKIGASNSSTTGVLGIWTAGMPPFVFPEGMGRVLQPDTRILVNSHYHPFGEATTDRSRIGLYFGKGELKKEVATMVVVNTGMRIAPGEANHAEHAFYTFDTDMQLVAFSPHMHLRGKSMRYDLTYPDGRVETLLNVPKYNYNWQWQYYPTEPIDVPAGSRMDVTAVWDNSPENSFNPDPSKEIIYRGDVFNEMFVGFFEAIPKNGVYHQPLSAKEKLTSLLRAHPPEHCYLVGGFLPFGLYVPKEGEGWLYLTQGMNMFTISLDDFAWDGKKLLVTTQLPTPEASATTTIIEAELDENGILRGMLHYGTDSEHPLNSPMAGQPMTEILAKSMD